MPQLDDCGGNLAVAPLTGAGGLVRLMVGDLNNAIPALPRWLRRGRGNHAADFWLGSRDHLVIRSASHQSDGYCVPKDPGDFS